MYNIWSTEFLENVSSYTCYVNEKEWFMLQSEFHTSKMFVRIIKGDKYWICALDSPNNEVPDTTICVPIWMLEQIDSYGGELLEVEFMPADVFDHSEQVVLEALDDTIDVDDIQELLSNELTKLAILQKGTIIHITIEEYVMFYKVVSLAPASVVLCQGDNVYLEFQKYELPSKRPDTPIPSPIPHISELLSNSESFPPVPVRFNPWRNKDFKPNMS